jgi:DNA polymerase-4
MSPPQDYKYLFIDMNSFFASCEQQANAFCRNKPVIVTPINTPNGCTISASYEAKKFGIKTGTLLKDAMTLCPNVIICQSNVKMYIEYHKKIVKIIKQFSPFVFIKSIDEAAIKLSPSERNFEKSVSIAKKLKQLIYSELGEYMRSSVGVGPNIWLSKMAAESQKPDGLVILKISELDKFYKSLELTDLKGIARRTKTTLNYLGFYKPIDLFNATSEELRKKMGLPGEYWNFRLHGYDIDVPNQSIAKSVGQSHVLEPKFRNWDKAWQVCQKLVERAAKRLRDDGLVANGVSLYVKTSGGPSWHKSYKTTQFSDSQTFLKLVFNLWDQVVKDDPPFKIGISVFNLSKPGAEQLKIFPQMQKAEYLYKAIDKINDQYGNFTIKPANLLSVESSAPLRISFGQPMDR